MAGLVVDGPYAVAVLVMFLRIPVSRAGRGCGPGGCGLAGGLLASRGMSFRLDWPSTGPAIAGDGGVR
jgi:hypothetical protein